MVNAAPGTETKKELRMLTPRQSNLIDQIADIGYGRIKVVIHAGEPIRIEEPIKVREL